MAHSRGAPLLFVLLALACLAVANGQCASTYTVQEGDYLYKIGQKFGVRWEDIQAANRDQIPDANTIYPGMRLKIPSCYGTARPYTPTRTQPTSYRMPPEQPRWWSNPSGSQWSAPSWFSDWFPRWNPRPAPAWNPTPAPTWDPAPAPVWNPSPAPVWKPSPSPVPVPTSVPSRPMAPTGGTCANYKPGDATYYHQNGGYTACGERFTDDEMVAAISWRVYDRSTGNPNTSPSCQKCAEVCGPKGKAVVRIKDKCGGCKEPDIDLSPTAFKKVVGDLGIGRQPGVTWHCVDCSTGVHVDCGESTLA